MFKWNNSKSIWHGFWHLLRFINTCSTLSTFVQVYHYLLRFVNMCLCYNHISNLVQLWSKFFTSIKTNGMVRSYFQERRLIQRSEILIQDLWIGFMYGQQNIKWTKVKLTKHRTSLSKVTMLSFQTISFNFSTHYKTWRQIKERH